MHVELVESLRCLAPHADTWLVAAATRTAGREIIAGTLGCPTCGAEYALREGAVWYGLADDSAAAPGAAAPADDEVTRLGALLGVDGSAGLYVLCGTWGAMADGIAAFAPAARILLVAPPPRVAADGTLRGTGDALPLAPGAARGVALDRASGALAAAAARALAVKGRLVAPAAAPVPEEVTVLARDDRHWVGERAAGVASAPVRLGRAGPRRGSR